MIIINCQILLVIFVKVQDLYRLRLDVAKVLAENRTKYCYSTTDANKHGPISLKRLVNISEIIAANNYTKDGYLREFIEPCYAVT